MKKIWKRIETWLIENTPPNQERIPLPPGVSEAALEKAEATFGFRLPKDVRESYKCHNGTYNPGVKSRNSRICLWEAASLMPLAPFRNVARRHRGTPNVVGSWKFMKRLLEEGMWDGMENEPEGPINICWWNTRWVPLTDNQCGDNICVDMAPAKGGKRGQVIDWWHEAGATVILANGFREWLSDYADKLEAGHYEFNGTSVSKKL